VERNSGNARPGNPAKSGTSGPQVYSQAGKRAEKAKVGKPRKIVDPSWVSMITLRLKWGD
jgi:hypothetical protein